MTTNLDRDLPAAKGAVVHHGQVRMAYRLAANHAHRLMYVHGLGWHVWDGSRWVEDQRGAAKRAVLHELRTAWEETWQESDEPEAERRRKQRRAEILKCESASGVAGVLNLAASLEPLAHTVSDLDADPYLLNTASGTLDLRTMHLRDADPADRITKVTRGSYDPQAVGNVWSGFLERVLPDPDLRAFLQRVSGVGLLGLVVEQILVILTGTGANGKGVFYGALGHTLGDYATVAEPDLFMHRDGAHPTGEMDLRGIRWVVVSESDRGRRLAEATMKRLTGGDEIKARRMRQDFVRFTPSHTPVLVTNHLPKVSGDDPALWRRMRVVPFGVVIPDDERDTHLAERLQLEADAVLSWAIAGYRAYIEASGLAEPDSVRLATDAYQRSSDAVARYVDECCLRNPHMWLTTGAAFERWQKWAANDGADSMSLKAFGQALDRLGFPADPNRRRRRHGIGLATDEAEEDA